MTRLGQVDLFVQLSYVLFLGLIGAMMLQESLRSLLARPQGRGTDPAVACPFLGAWPAVQDEVPGQRALHQRDPAA